MGALGMSSNLGSLPASAKGLPRPTSTREGMEKEILGRLHGETWTQRYREHCPRAVETWAALLADMREPLHNQITGVASLLGIAPNHMGAYLDGRRSMPALPFVALFGMSQREPAEATDLALARLAALKGRTVGTLPPGAVEAIHEAFARTLEQWGRLAGTVVRALEDGRIEGHEVVDVLRDYRLLCEFLASLEACVIAAEVQQ
jgi:hypothetical protein